MIYTRAHDRTVAEDYYAAMAQIEKRLDLTAGAGVPDNTDDPISAGERARLLELVSQLAEPQLGLNARLNLVEQMRRVLDRAVPEQVEAPTDGNGRGSAALTDLTALASVAQS
jgi:hypothetical protein